jgi:hypothetical protein
LYERSACWALTEVAIAPCGGYPKAVEYIDGMGNTIASAITTVIVGCREDIKASFTEGYCEGFGGGEHGITAVRLTSKGRLQIAYRQVCSLNGGAYKTKALSEIIAPIRLGCCTYLRPMSHNVSSKDKLERIAT